MDRSLQPNQGPFPGRRKPGWQFDRSATIGSLLWRASTRSYLPGCSFFPVSPHYSQGAAIRSAPFVCETVQVAAPPHCQIFPAAFFCQPEELFSSTGEAHVSPHPHLRHTRAASPCHCNAAPTSRAAAASGPARCAARAPAPCASALAAASPPRPSRSLS